MASKPEEVKIVEESTIKSKVVDHDLWRDKFAVIASAFVVTIFAMSNLVVMLISFSKGHEPPTWATAMASSTITAAVAILFKHQLPGGNWKR